MWLTAILNLEDKLESQRLYICDHNTSIRVAGERCEYYNKSHNKHTEEIKDERKKTEELKNVLAEAEKLLVNLCCMEPER